MDFFSCSLLDQFAVYFFASPCHPKEQCTRALFFAHANGIPACTYQQPFFEKWLAQNPGAFIVAYDGRGIAGSAKVATSLHKCQTGWPQLVQDHLDLWKTLSALYPGVQWTFAGHSLGAWLSLLAIQFVQDASVSKEVFLYDLPLFPLKAAFIWAFLCVTGLKRFSRRSRQTTRRRTTYPSAEDVRIRFQRSRLMRHWSPLALDAYIRYSFDILHNGSLHLKHQPSWEVALFNQYPLCAAKLFLSIPKKIRKTIKPIFMVGDQSETCNPKAGLWVKIFFPLREWNVVPGDHMFLMVDESV